jgi:transposase
LKEFLEVALRRWPAIDPTVGIQEGQILTLDGGKSRLIGQVILRHEAASLRLFLAKRLQCVNVRYRVELSELERQELKGLVSGGEQPVRRLKRAQILLASDLGQSEEGIAKALSVGISTVYRTRRRFVEANLEGALSEEPRAGAARKLKGNEEVLLVATACSKAPEGCARWTLDLLAGRMVELTEHAQLSRETIRRRLHENELKPWQRKMWCIAKVHGEYVARMENVLDLYTKPAAANIPVVSFDESPVQLIDEVRAPLPALPGQAARYDSEYKRNGTANLFVMVDVHQPWRHVKVTDQRAGQDFAACMRDLVDLHYPQAEKIRVVLDNLSTHSAASLYNSFAPQEARRIMSKIEFNFVPKHASWLNMVEIEIGVLRTQCLDRRIAERAELESEIAIWEKRRNANQEKIQWMFDCEKARQKMRDAYAQLKPQTDALLLAA